MIELTLKQIEWLPIKKKDNALTSAGIKVIRWKVVPMPSCETIKESFNLHQKNDIGNEKLLNANSLT
jgi:hypothetical protein